MHRRTPTAALSLTATAALNSVLLAVVSPASDLGLCCYALAFVALTGLACLCGRCTGDCTGDDTSPAVTSEAQRFPRLSA